MAGDERPRPGGRLRPLAAAAVALAAAAFVLVGHLVLVWNAPLDFDEAYNLQIPLNLHLRGRYQTWYDAPRPFAHQITTGPTVLLPVAGMFALAGPAHRAARLVMTAFLLGYLWQTWWLCRRLTGRAAPALFAAAALLFAWTPQALLASKSVLGEVPGLFFFLTGARLLDGALRGGGRRRAAAAGAVMGLAVVSKLILLAFAITTAAALLIVAGRHARGARGLVGWYGGGLLLPPAAWQAVTLAALGWPGYRQHLAGSLALFRFGGSGAGWAVWRDRPGALEHLAALAAELREPTWIVGAALLGAAAIGAWTFRRAPRPFVAWCVVLPAAVVWAWWLFVSSWVSLRHLLPGGAMLALLLPYAAWAVLGDPGLRPAVRRGLAGAVAVLALLLLPPRLPAELWDGGAMLRDQEAAARAVRGLRARSRATVFWGFGWRQAPEISFLARLPFEDLTRRRPLGRERNYFVTSVSSLLGPPEPRQYQERHCRHDVYRGTGSRVCRLAEDAPRARDQSYRP